ncbi:MAG: GLPGLI family protein [Saprospiraceae bacterium]|nr:GLPGLI family protein [Saprospiraceae bacterium]
MTDNPNFYRDTLFFNGNDILYIQRRGYQEWKTKEGFTFHNQATNSKWYFNLVDRNSILKKFNFEKKVFTIQGEVLKNNSWKIIDEFKTIGKFKAQKAHLKIINDYGEFDKYAWFTPDIPISAGPDKMWGLPGLILELRLNGTCTCTMESMVMKPIENIKFNEGNVTMKNANKKPNKNKKKLNELLNKD